MQNSNAQVQKFKAKLVPLELGCEEESAKSWHYHRDGCYMQVIVGMQNIRSWQSHW
jgi:SH3-like domain-containing protein